MQRAFSSIFAVALLVGCASQSELESSNSEISIPHKAQVTIDAPALGGHVATTSDGMVDVSGTARGQSINVNGTSVAVDAGGKFKARVSAKPGVNVISAKLNQFWGGEAQRAFVYGDFAEPKKQLPSGVLVRANANAFDDFNP